VRHISNLPCRQLPLFGSLKPVTTSLPRLHRNRTPPPDPSHHRPTTMRATPRLLTARLPAFSPTGIAGVLTHPHPRPALIALYNHTLAVLSKLPPHSVYRQSTEALTQRRLDAVSAVKPAGWNDYLATRRQNGLQGDVDIRDVAAYMRARLHDLVETTTSAGSAAYAGAEMRHWAGFPAPAGHDDRAPPEPDPAADPLDDADADDSEELEHLVRQRGTEIELEPQLSAEQVAEIEHRIGEGLLEQVIEEGWAELQCAEAMRDDRVWEPLAVVPEEGQWVGFERPAVGP